MDPALTAELRERREADLARGYTGWGPTSTSFPSRRAVARCAATARRASNARRCWRCCSPSTASCSTTAAPPLMLLDDARRARRRAPRLLVERLAVGGGQALITATEPQHLPRAGERHEVAIRGGRALTATPADGGAPPPSGERA